MRMSESQIIDKTVVLGIGNLLQGDDGVGVHVAQELSNRKLPDHVEVIDAGTAFIDVMYSLENVQRIIVLDAMKAGRAPGTIYRMKLDQCHRKPYMDSMHSFDIFRMLELVENNNTVEVLLLCIEPEVIDWGMELSDPVSRVIPSFIELVEKEIKLKQFDVQSN